MIQDSQGKTSPSWSLGTLFHVEWFNVAWQQYTAHCPSEQRQVTKRHFMCSTLKNRVYNYPSVKWPKFMFTVLEVILTLVYEFIAGKLELVHQRTGIFQSTTLWNYYTCEIAQITSQATSICQILCTNTTRVEFCSTGHKLCAKAELLIKWNIKCCRVLHIHPEWGMTAQKN